jgi:glutamate formiminotransferase
MFHSIGITARQVREFPTVALNVNFSETNAKLEKDIAWWINESKGEVRIGVTIDIKRRSRCIEIKSWSPPGQHSSCLYTLTISQ